MKPYTRIFNRFMEGVTIRYLTFPLIKNLFKEYLTSLEKNSRRHFGKVVASRKVAVGKDKVPHELLVEIASTAEGEGKMLD